MPQTLQDRTIALAGLLLSAQLVRDIAYTGRADADDFETCMHSLLQIDAESSAAVYGGLARLRSGLRLLSGHLSNPKDMDVTRYAVNLLVLEGKLRKQPSLLQRIRAGIETGSARALHCPADDNALVAGFADLYSSTISTLKPRIMVKGDAGHLNQPTNQNRIRALLLAGIRAATLWRQSGGGRLTLLLRRKALVRESQRLLAELGE
jgi:high frequency lysogenization protein